MAIGKPFQKGREKTGGRAKGVPDKDPKLPVGRLNNRIRRHIDRSMARHEAGIDKISDAAEALRIDARFNRDLVEMLAYTTKAEEAQRAGHLSDAQVETEAKRQGPVTDEDAMAAYFRMLKASADESRILAARHALSRDVPVLLTEVPKLRDALAAGNFEVRAEVGLSELFKALPPPEKPSTVRSVPASMPVPRPAPTTERTSQFEHSDVGIPVGDGVRYVPAPPRQLRERELYPDPGIPQRMVDGEVTPVETGRLVPLDREPRVFDADLEDRHPWDDDATLVVGGGFVRR